MARILGGTHRGRPFAVPGVAGLRMTSQKVRQAAMSILKPHVVGAEILELFCGAGGVGLEALSQGAARVVFLDRDNRCREAVLASLRAFGWLERAEVLLGPVSRSLRALAAGGRQFDLCFMDPPYLEEDAVGTLLAIDRCAILRPTSCVLVEHSKREPLPDLVGQLRIQRRYRYGDSRLSLYVRPEVGGRAGPSERSGDSP